MLKKAKRHFNSNQKYALFIHANGKCEMCGKPLTYGWHADHVKPYSRGGKTDVLNGQALCARCNLKKGARMTNDLREWQKRFIGKVDGCNKKDFLLVATPGSGKTTAALTVAKTKLENGSISRVVVVVPTTQLKKQWADAAKAFGIAFTTKYSNSKLKISGAIEPLDTHGVVITYPQIGREPELHRVGCRKPTMVIFDEIHHAGSGENLVWGEALIKAFGEARFRLLMSGTPFRSDGAKIPFVTYSDCGAGEKSVPDFIYGYDQAIEEGICRTVIFPSYDGQLEWSINDTEFEATFQDDLTQSGESARLRTALSHRGETLVNMIRHAQKKLDELRANGNPSAAGLVTTISHFDGHAQGVANLIEKITGHKPVVVTSAEEDPHNRIEVFADSNDMWLVSVRMVSEGIDIPRLQVGIYASNIVQELFFRQFVGRFVRGGDLAWVYVPADKRIIEMVERIKEERDHYVLCDPPKDPEEDSKKRGCIDGLEHSVFMPIKSECDLDSCYHEGKRYTAKQISLVEQVKSESAEMAAIGYDVLLNMLQKFGNKDAFNPNDTQSREEPFYDKKPTREDSYDTKRKKMSEKIQTHVGIIYSKTGEDYSKIHAKANKYAAAANQKQNSMTIDQMKRKEEFLLKWRRRITT